MTMNAAEKRQKIIDRASGKTDEPIISSEANSRYQVQLMSALNWYAKEADSKQRKAWALSYFKKQKNQELVDHLSEIGDWEFHSLGVLCRLKSRGSFLSEQHEKYIDSRATELLKMPLPKKVVVAAAPVPTGPTIQERILEKSKEIAGDIDGQIDEFIATGCPANYKMSFNGMTAPIAKYVSAYIKPTLTEVQEAIEGEDEQLVEGYSNFTKPQLKRFANLLQSIVEKSEQAKKIIRKPTVRKAKPAGVIVAKMKFKAEDTELGLKSISAPSIVGADELWVYNTKYRKLMVYRAASGLSLTVKGTSILNYDTTNSVSKTLRKPQEQLTPMLAMTKRPLSAAFKAVKCKEATPNGRINEECILFKVFQ